jgi:hypothetical protein
VIITLASPPTPRRRSQARLNKGPGWARSAGCFDGRLPSPGELAQALRFAHKHGLRAWQRRPGEMTYRAERGPFRPRRRVVRPCPDREQSPRWAGKRAALSSLMVPTRKCCCASAAAAQGEWLSGLAQGRASSVADPPTGAALRKGRGTRKTWTSRAAVGPVTPQPAGFRRQRSLNLWRECAGLSPLGCRARRPKIERGRRLYRSPNEPCRLVRTGFCPWPTKTVYGPLQRR